VGNVFELTGNGYMAVDGQFGAPADLTLAAWVDLTDADRGGAELISLGNNVSIRLDDGGKLVARQYQADGSFLVTQYDVTLAGSGWRHVAYTFDDATRSATLYLDGVAVAGGTAGSPIQYVLGTNTVIGRAGDGLRSDLDFTGRIDEVRIYGRALTADEVCTLAIDAAMTDSDTVPIMVTAVNDAPVATIVAASYSAIQQFNLELQRSGLQIADVDAGNDGVQATVSVGYGILTAQAGGTGVTVAGSGTAAVTLTGTVQQINSLLAGDSSGTLYFLANTASPPASTVLTLSVDDLGNAGSGGSMVGLRCRDHPDRLCQRRSRCSCDTGVEP